MKTIFKISLTLFLTSTFTTSLQAQTPLVVPSEKTYKSGRQLCKENEIIISFQKGFFTEVPIDYDDLSKGVTPIYAWFEGAPFNPSLPTIAHFTGGPGATSHWGSGELPSPENYNFLTIDFRGIGCSKPDKLSDYLNPKFHSSVNIARDLEEIRKSLKIEKLTLHGVSYGTVPATIYASLFPQTTTAVILEGTIYSTDSLYQFPQREKILLNAVSKLPEKAKARVINLTHKYGMSPSWFFKWVRDTLLSNGAAKDLNEKLLKLEDDKFFDSFKKMLIETYGPQPEFEKNLLFVFNVVPYYMLSCQELSLGDANTTFELQWNFEFVNEFNKNPSANTLTDFETEPFSRFYNEALNDCRKLNILSSSGYHSKNYPIHVPVTYFQGLNDPATEINQAMFHYDKTAQGLKQLVVLNNGGHNPISEGIRVDQDLRAVWIKAMFGEKILQEDFTEINKQLIDSNWFVFKSSMSSTTSIDVEVKR